MGDGLCVGGGSGRHGCVTVGHAGGDGDLAGGGTRDGCWRSAGCGRCSGSGGYGNGRLGSGDGIGEQGWAWDGVGGQGWVINIYQDAGVGVLVEVLSNCACG